MKRLGGYWIYIIVAITSLSLVANIFVIHRNNLRVRRIALMEQNAANAKFCVQELLRNIHMLDVGIRGYAISKNPAMLVPFDSANARKSRLLMKTELALIEFPEIQREFKNLKQGIENYYLTVNELKRHLDANDQTGFNKLFNSDEGKSLAADYRQFQQSIYLRQEQIVEQSEIQFHKQFRSNLEIQLGLFIFITPLLVFMAYHTNNRVESLHQISLMEAERADMERNNSLRLEEEVQNRTAELTELTKSLSKKSAEILAKNTQLSNQQEEITRQNALLKKQHQETLKAQELIRSQNNRIHLHNLDLVREVERQTVILTRANNDLKERNSRLEKFAYVISHNLRGPLSRIQGLANVIHLSENMDELKMLASRMGESTYDLDQVIKDLSTIIEVRNLQAKELVPVKISEVIQKVTLALAQEIRSSSTILLKELEVDEFWSYPLYIESICYNLISNSIKYRNFEPPVITIVTKQKPDGIQMEFRDNGIGLDLKTHGSSLFLPFKRFHYHVPGKGLGLYLVKAQTESLGGTLQIESTPGQGTTFKLMFPARVIENKGELSYPTHP